MNSTAQELQIHDIRGIVEIPDWSFGLFLALCFTVIVILALIVYLIFNYIKKKKNTVRKEYYSILQTLDLNDTKTAAYSITKHGSLLAQTQREKRLIAQLNAQLEEHKYKKSVSSFDDSIKNQFQIFMESIDV
ncbi:MAG: hypothetical protein U9N30_00390 [Campylobacterota bacterium]|nr:hypothetical protein [Campylobacterota bacterium]